jgi:hypothetical protein
VDGSGFNRLPVTELLGFFGVLLMIGAVAVVAWLIVAAVWLYRHVSILVQ